MQFCIPGLTIYDSAKETKKCFLVDCTYRHDCSRNLSLFWVLSIYCSHNVKAYSRLGIAQVLNPGHICKLKFSIYRSTSKSPLLSCMSWYGYLNICWKTKKSYWASTHNQFILTRLVLGVPDTNVQLRSC